MKRPIGAALGCGLLLLSGLPAAAQSTPNTAMNAPDQVAWQIFIQVNTRAGGSNATFETWASDTDTFQPNRSFRSRQQRPYCGGRFCQRSRARACRKAVDCFPLFPPA